MSHHGHLFAYLTQAKEGQRLERTTNSLEGGVNSQIKKLMYAHRGLRNEQLIACDWWLYLHTQLPDDPVEIARQQNWGQDALAKAQTLPTRKHKPPAATKAADREPTTAPSTLPTTTLWEYAKVTYAKPQPPPTQSVV